MKLYPNSKKTTFGYWFAHWCQYQRIAFKLKVWKPKFLLHDIEKPWLYLIFPYQKVRLWHKTHADHHLMYKYGPIDWVAMYVDWESSRFSKLNGQMTVQETLNYEIERFPQYKDALIANMQPLIDKYASRSD